MNCRDRKESITLYVSGELREQSRRELESHLKECPFCRAKLSAAESLEELLRGQTLEPVPVGLSGSVMRAVDEFEAESSSLESALTVTLIRIRRFSFWEELLALGGLCVAVVLFVYVFLPQIEGAVQTLSAIPGNAGADLFFTALGIKSGGINLTYLNPPLIIFSILFGLVNVFGVPRSLRPGRLLALVRFW